MNGAKISVIVPVYKVEPYLRKCLDSIVGQSHKNLEIILVDDGSPDRCGAICDEYAAQDGRVRVIHKENGGLSSARNAALEAATGEYIGFVDSDDWIEPDMFDYLLRGMQRYRADVGVCGVIEEYPKRQACRGWDRVEAFGREDGIRLLLQSGTFQSMWDKLWKRELFEGVRFPQGRNYEDLAVAHRLLARAAGLVCLPEAKYHYLQRANSIMGDGSLANRLDRYAAAKERYREMRDVWPQYRELMEAQCIAAAVSAWGVYLFNPPETRRAYRGQIEEMAAFSRAHPAAAGAAARSLGRAGRAVLPLTRYPSWWAFALAGIWNWTFQIRHRHPL